MDAATFRTELEESKRTELDRLGSNKLLIALTDATLETGAVLRAAADSEHAARRTFEAWAEDATGDAREAFAFVAEREADHERRVLDALRATTGEMYEPSDGGTLHSYLREREGVVERAAAGLVGRATVSDRTHAQIVSFFVNEADEIRADLFRALRTETEEELERGLELLDAHCETDEDWERARMVAEYVVDVAYDDYADALKGLGVDVKPVC
ncbi:MAG: rubrerythrin family protein [Halobaculum sp.]